MGVSRLVQARMRDNHRQHMEDDDLNGGDLSLPAGAIRDGTSPRALYIDGDDDLAMLLDRVEDAGSPAIIVLPEGARAIHGVVSARLLSRRAEAAGIPLVAVTTDRTAIAQLTGVGISCVPTVGEARAILAGRHQTGGQPATIEPAAAPHRPPDLPAAAESPVPATVVVEDDPADSDGAQRHAVLDPVPDDDHDRAPPASVARDAGDVKASAGKVTPRPRRRWPLAVAALALLALLGAAIWVVLFPQATVTIRYREQPFSQVFDVPLGAGSAGSIVLHRTHLELSDSRVVAGTGSTLVPDKHATGSVTFANQLDGVVIVPAGTIVVTQNGTRYVTTAETRVPGAVHSFSGTSNGQASITVEAVTAGNGSNAGPGAIVGLEGRLAGALLVTNYAALTGGTMRTVYRITQADLEAPVDPLRQALAAREKAELTSRYSKSPLRQFDPPVLLPTKVRQFDQAGKPYARITVTIRTNMRYVHAEDVQAFAMTRRTAALADKNQRIVPGTGSFSVRAVTVGLQTQLQVQVTARTAPSIDTANLRALLTGRGVADARQLLDGSAQNGNWQYTLRTSPDWAARLPIASGLISISVERQG